MGGDRDGVGGERSQDLVPAEELLGRGVGTGRREPRAVSPTEGRDYEGTLRSGGVAKVATPGFEEAGPRERPTSVEGRGQEEGPWGGGGGARRVEP